MTDVTENALYRKELIKSLLFGLESTGFTGKYRDLLAFSKNLEEGEKPPKKFV